MSRRLFTAARRQLTTRSKILSDVVKGSMKAIPPPFSFMNALIPPAAVRVREFLIDMPDELVANLNPGDGLYNFMTYELIGMLLLEMDFELHGVTNLPIYQPIAKKDSFIITGLPQTGSTVLQTLLSLDEQSRAIRQWEANIPYSFAGDPDARFHTASANLYNPNYHPSKMNGVNDVAEDMLITRSVLDYAAVMRYFQGDAPEIGTKIEQKTVEWLRSDKTILKQIEFHRHFILSVNAQRGAMPDHWIFKEPSRLPSVELMTRVYGPSLKVIFTHRNVAHVLHSAKTKWSNEVGLDTSHPGTDRASLLFVRDNWNKALDYRTKAEETNPGMFYDVYFDELMADPMGTIKDLYTHYGMSVTPQHDSLAERQFQTTYGGTKNLRTNRNYDRGASTGLPSAFSEGKRGVSQNVWRGSCAWCTTALIGWLITAVHVT